MLGEFITRGLVLVLGYAYPAFECFRTVEKNRVEIEELRFWCQYWIIVAVLTVLERIGDIFISWLPMYGEMKLALFIYLWYPKTKGTGYVYETLLRPYVVNHEPGIDRNFQELRARTWDLALYYWQNCTNLGQSTFFQIIQYLAAQSGKFSKTNNEEKNKKPYPTAAAPPPSPTGSPYFHLMPHKRK
ncbi:HVA22-like protein [Actinidia chinensis var. chinensis]|uniref:HVA22-like protein n=1 Tax=Actinidia chinensis var. chinensis TaxID=1590841 RepID=A0A2R6QVX2_ACTCC|nr:HVA22-like protein [Actinidia chinensis var. chinensis]